MKRSSSPWKNTRVIDKLYLDILNIRSIPYEDDDVLYTVTPTYTHRPDLLANDLYGDPGLWWVFAQRNMDIIDDPVYDLVAGIEIRLPKSSNLVKLLG